MTLKLQAVDSIYKPKNLSSFIKHLRHYQKKSIVNSGSYLCWEEFRNREFQSKFLEEFRLINAYAPKVILLALATANDCRNLTVDNEEFYNLCSNYLHIPSSIATEGFLDKEADKIATELETLSHNSDNIQSDKIDINNIRAICGDIFIARSMGAQNRDFLPKIEEFYRDYCIIQQIDAETSGNASNILKDVFNMDILRIIRSAWSLFSLGNDTGKNGALNFNRLTCNADFTKKFNIDLDTCFSLALNTSYKESNLRSEWLEEVQSEEEIYQQYAPDPLFLQPVIHRDQFITKNQFLIPVPWLFIRSFRQSIFSTLYNNEKNKEEKGEMGNQIGKAIERHIQEALEHIFNKKNVQKLESENKHVDFLASLKNIDLVIEVKSMIGGFSEKYIMNPAHIAKVWNLFYGACKQCAHSLSEYRKGRRKIVSIVLVADHITAEHLPFQHYASISGLFDDLG